MVWLEAILVNHGRLAPRALANPVDDVIDPVQDDVRSLPWTGQLGAHTLLPLRIVQPNSVSWLVLAGVCTQVVAGLGLIAQGLDVLPGEVMDLAECLFSFFDLGVS